MRSDLFRSRRSAAGRRLVEVHLLEHELAPVPAKVTRRELKRRGVGLPDFHALRHGAAMDCDDAEEARDLLRHKNSNVTRAVYRAHFGDRRRELLRARMEARLEASDPDGAQSAEPQPPAEVADLQARRGAA